MGYRKPYDYDLLEAVIFTDADGKIIDWSRRFADANPIVVEVGCGNGHFLINKAISRKDRNFIGIDIKKNRIVRCREKQEKYGVPNISWICGEAVLSLKTLFEDGSLTEVYMPFSDPWPKRRHHKHRMFGSPFIDLLHVKLKNNGLFFFITDHQEYFNASIKIVSSETRFDHKLMNEADDSEFGRSLFGEKWKKDSRSFYAFELIKK